MRDRLPVSLSHLTLPTRQVEATARFFEETLGYARDAAPANSPMETVWLNATRGQQFHIVYVDGFATSPFEGEFGRHIAVFHPVADFDGLKRRLTDRGAEVFDALRPVPFARFFFREPVNGYVFEVIDGSREAAGLA
jgi:catechol 2,3-dioxygenase-like lactoylglutathione lyase family enzyme